jgi:hypothetical protein
MCWVAQVVVVELGERRRQFVSSSRSAILVAVKWETRPPVISSTRRSRSPSYAKNGPMCFMTGDMYALSVARGEFVWACPDVAGGCL